MLFFKKITLYLFIGLLCSYNTFTMDFHETTQYGSYHESLERKISEYYPDASFSMHETTWNSASYTIHEEDVDIHVKESYNPDTNTHYYDAKYEHHNNSSNHYEPSSNQESVSHHNSNDHDHLKDHLHDSAVDNRRQEIDEERQRHYENKLKYDNRNISPKNLYGKDLDAVLILNKVNTISDLIAAISSPTVKAYFKGQKYKIESQPKRKGEEAKLIKQSLNFIDALLSDQVLIILNRIKSANLAGAEDAFAQLKWLWPWKRDYTFLSINSPVNTGEFQFKRNTLKVDIMKIAEKCFITRKDYLAKYANSEQMKAIQEYKDLCPLLFLYKGNAFFDEYRRMQFKIAEDNKVVKNNSRNKKAINNIPKNNLVDNVCFAFIDNLYNDPIVIDNENKDSIRDIFYSIRNRPLAEAQQELQNFELQILRQARSNNIVLMQDIKTWIINQYGFDVLDLANTIYISHPDYSNKPENESVFSDELAPILDNIECQTLPIAYAELIHLEEQLSNEFKSLNIQDKTEQKKCLIEDFGTNPLDVAQATYRNNPNYQYITQHFVPIDFSKVTIKIVKQSPNCASIAREFNHVADQVFHNAELCQINFLSNTKPRVYASINALKKPHDTFDFVCNLTSVDHTLHSLQQQSQDIIEGIQTPPHDSTPLLESIDTIHNEKLEAQIPFTEQMVELQHQHEMYKHLYQMREQCAPLLYHAIERRMKALENIKNGNTHFVTKEYDINRNTEALLREYKHNALLFTSLTGNEYQHVLHTESLEIIDAINKLSRDSRIYNYRGAIIDYAAAVCEYNQDGLTHKATQVADLCWILLDYGSAIAEGAIIGAKSALTDMIEHPVQTVVCAFAGEYVLAYQVCKVACDVAGIGITALTDTTKAKKEWNDYIAPLNQFISSIKHEKITLRQMIQSGTAVVVGWRAQHKVLGGTSKLCKSVKENAIKFAQNNPLVKPKGYMATPEGMLFKATKNSLSKKDANVFKFKNNQKLAKTKNITTTKETTSLHKKHNSNKSGGSSKETVKTEALVKNKSQLPKDRPPIDSETILASGKFQRTNFTYDGARVYKKDNKFYHRDQLHIGESAHLEVYNKRGKHIGIADPLTGELIEGTAVPGRQLPM